MQQDKSRRIEVEVQSDNLRAGVALILVTSAALSGHCCGVLSPYFQAIICQTETSFPVTTKQSMLMGNVWPCF